MSIPNKVFHLAIPCKDLQEAADFYVNVLGCKLARRYQDRITLDFFGDQVVCHLSPDNIDSSPKMYPRHFGMTFTDEADFDAVLKRATDNNAQFFEKEFTRFAGKQEQHRTFFLIDPSNNLIEFKYYYDNSMIY